MLRPHNVGVALASTLVIWWAACSLLWVVAPRFSLAYLSSLFHGFELNIAASPMTLGSFLIGVVVLAIDGYIGGFLFAVIYQASVGASKQL